jgi:protein-S-isoprenylcysteine O-methyltransferase Ste14
MRRLPVAAVVIALAALAFPASALAHDAPESEDSRWVMTDWMLNTFFVIAGVALVAFLLAWKAGHFHNLEEAARVPLGIEEEDYYTPDWAFDEEEWADGDAKR